MGKLSSCYFCGSALDVSLSEYPVVPKQFRIEERDSTTVVLCDPCRRKLATVIEDVVDAAAVDADIDTDIETTAEGPDSVTELSGESSETTAPRSATSSGDTSGRTEPAETPPDDSSAGATDNTDPQSTADETDGRATDDGAATDDSPSLSRLEYNKVMRLLQNRQFPVDRAEIRDVAVSAYDVDPSEFDAIVDAAIDRELIAERNGQFVDPAE